MNQMLAPITEYLWSQSWQIALLVSVVAAMTRLLRGRSAHLRYLLWLLVLAKCLVPPAFHVGLPILPPAGEAAMATPYEQLADGSPGFTEPGLPATAVPPEPDGPIAGGRQSGGLLSDVSPRQVLVMLWLAGTVLLLVAAVVKALRTQCRLGRRRRELPGRLQHDVEGLLASFAMRWRPRVWLVDEVGQPFVWGLLRGSVYLPASFPAMGDAAHRRNVLAHEISHVWRFDAGINLLQVLAQAIFWFHPLVWWANRRLRAEREKACDEMAIARTGARPRDYSRAIVEALLNEHQSLRPVPSLAIVGPTRSVEERIRTMLRPGRRFYGRPSSLAAAGALLLAVLIVPTTLALTDRPPEAANARATATSAEAGGDSATRERMQSAQKLKRIGLSLAMYAQDRNEKYPDSLMALMPYFSEEDAEPLGNFISSDAEYLGAGKTRPKKRAGDIPLAYDLTLLRTAGGTNVVFADGHVAFLGADQLKGHGIELPQSALDVVDVRLEPIHQGKNVVHVTVKNTSDTEQHFATHIYTRSPDYGVGGVGWGTPFFDTIGPDETKPVRFVFKIQGPVTDRTYVRLRFYNPETPDDYDYKRHFERRRYTSAELPNAKEDEAACRPASAADAQAVTQAFNQIQSHVRQRRYEQAWERFSRDYQDAEYQMPGIKAFRRAMEPTHPMHSAFTWERDEFLSLTPGRAFKTDGALALTATTDEQTWTIDFVREGGQWKIDWIAGYVPGIIRMQEPERRAPADKAGNLKVLDVRLPPIQLGKNVARVRIRNLTEQDQPFGIDIRVESLIRNWQRQFQHTIEGGATEWLDYEFEVLGPLTDTSFVRLRFYNPASTGRFDMDDWFAERRYRRAQLELHESLRGTDGPVSEVEKKTITEAFKAFQDHIRKQEFEAAWEMLSQQMRSSYGNDLQRFRGQMGSESGRAAFLNLSLESVTRTGPLLTLNGEYETQSWKVHFIRGRDQWKIHHGQVSQGDWKKRLLPTMGKRVTDHFDTYYFKGSAAEREIDRITQQREQGYRGICAFLGTDSDVRICLVFFEDGQTKQRQTGHQGAGWAYGNTIVEVYNEKERLDPYHETVHILTGPLGNPPALFNEGFAVYMSERLGAHALASLGGGQATVHQRAKELKSRGEWIELPELLRFVEIGSKASRPPVAYAEAASFVKFLIDTHGRDKFLQAYRTLRNSRSASVHEANIRKLEEIYGRSLEKLQQQWEDTLNQRANSK
jgi:prepilin-type processing-associated H-X9-DG protein